MEYFSHGVAHTDRGGKEVLYRLTYWSEWLPERNCWRDVVVRQERCQENPDS